MKNSFLFSLFVSFLLLGCSSSQSSVVSTGVAKGKNVLVNEEFSSRVNEIRKVYKERGPIKLPAVVGCLGENYIKFKNGFWEDSLITKGLPETKYLLGILPDTSTYFNVIAEQTLDIYYPVCFTIDKNGNLVKKNYLFQLDTYEMEMRSDSVLYLSEYTKLNPDLSFVKVVEAVALFHVWEKGVDPIENDWEGAFKDSAVIRNVWSETNGYISKNGDVVVDWEKSIYEAPKVKRDTSIYFHYDWDIRPAFDWKKMLGHKVPEHQW